jgi:hypothetical protein
LKKKIEELLSGKFEYEQPQLLFSQDKITATLKAGETTRGSVYIGTEDDVKIRGYITSSDRRFVPGIDTFASTSVCLPYGIDAQGLNPGDAFKGWLCFTTNIGEYKLPFEVQIEKEEFPIDPAGFREVAKRDFREAHRLFTKKGFSGIFKDADKKEKALYAGLSVQPVSYQNVEEFLIARGDKEKVEISQKISGREFYEVKDSSLESFMIRRSGWGHLRLDIEARGSFLEVPKKVVTD